MSDHKGNPSIDPEYFPEEYHHLLTFGEAYVLYRVLMRIHRDAKWIGTPEQLAAEADEPLSVVQEALAIADEAKLLWCKPIKRPDGHQLLQIRIATHTEQGLALLMWLHDEDEGPPEAEHEDWHDHANDEDLGDLDLDDDDYDPRR